MRVLVCGDRQWTDRDLIRSVLKSVVSTHHDELIELIHGSAPGADTLARQIAEDLGLIVHAFPANWKRYGRSAGPIRNAEMIAQQPDLVLAFHADLSRSRGTKDLIQRARRAGIPGQVYPSQPAPHAPDESLA